MLLITLSVGGNLATDKWTCVDPAVSGFYKAGRT